MTPGELPVDVVVPARDEETTIGACLRAVLGSAAGLDLRVVVAADSCRDRTAAVAGSFATITVVQTSGGGKAGALNAADRLRRPGVPVVYLDADTVLLPGALRALAETLHATPEPLLAAPRPLLLRPRGRRERAFAAVWSGLPAVVGDVVGSGCYAVNAAGRALWDEFPPVAADDAFVRSRFPRGRQQVVDRGAFVLELPEGEALPRALARWRGGNQELSGADPGAGTLRNLLDLARRPAVWRHVPGFLAVSLAARRAPAEVAWQPHRPAAENPSPAGKEVVDVVVVTHRSRADILDCLASIRSDRASLRVTVFDNASNDGTADLLRDHPVRLIRSEQNLGFGAAVNRALTDTAGDQILLVNPDARPEPGAIDTLLALADRFPSAGLYGGRMSDDDGRLDPTSCLPLPGLSEALRFGLGLSALHGVPGFDPESLGGWRRTGLREVPALTGALLLVDRRLWDSLGGFDERFVLYGEDVDLCVRARHRGAAPLFCEEARYTHRGGGSSAEVDRWIWILRGRVTLYRTHLGPLAARAAITALRAGVRLRGSLARAMGQSTRWFALTHRRAEWTEGWPPGARLPGARPEPGQSDLRRSGLRLGGGLLRGRG